MAGTKADLLKVSKADVGYSRWNDPQSGTKFGRWYADLVKDKSFGYSGVPYCAMAVSYWLAQADIACTGFPAAYCPYIVRDAKNAGKLKAAKDLVEGDVILFDWENDGVSDHVGIVLSNNTAAKTLKTREGNTNNGAVAERTRAYSTVVGGITPDFGKSSSAGGATSSSSSNSGSSSSNSGSASSSGKGKKASPQLSIDGLWGTGTTNALQVYFGIASTYSKADGRIDDQPVAYKRSNSGCLQSSFMWVNKATKGSATIKALQKACDMAAKDQDGQIGPKTAKAIQAKLKVKNSSGKDIRDGKLESGGQSIKALQRALNNATL